MSGYDIVGYAYDADTHCEYCTRSRFNIPVGDVYAIDSEGNAVSPIFADNADDTDCCGDCFVNLLSGDLPEWVYESAASKAHYFALTGQEID